MVLLEVPLVVMAEVMAVATVEDSEAVMAEDTAVDTAQVLVAAMVLKVVTVLAATLLMAPRPPDTVANQVTLDLQALHTKLPLVKTTIKDMAGLRPPVDTELPPSTPPLPPPTKPSRHQLMDQSRMLPRYRLLPNNITGMALSRLHQATALLLKATLLSSPLYFVL